MEFLDILHSAYTHDNHKIMGKPHKGLTKLPQNIDKHSAAMSRPPKPPKNPLYVDDEPSSTYRVCLINGTTHFDNIKYNKRTLINVPDKLSNMTTKELHLYLLGESELDGINEMYHYPYTSLKYHLLTTGAIYCNYKQGYNWKKLCIAAVTDIEDYRTIFANDHLTLAMIPTSEALSEGLTFSSFGGHNPHMNFGNVWSRSNGWLIEPKDARLKALDFNLRKLTSWSTALHYMEDVLKHIDKTTLEGVKL